MIAASILAFVLLAFGQEMTGALALSRNNRNRSFAANLASREMDTVRAADFRTLAVGRSTSTYPLDGVDFTIVRDAELVGQTSTTSPCDGGAGSHPTYLRVTVLVTWPVMAGAKPVQSSTIITPPVGSYDPSSGNVAIKVLDAGGRPASDRTVNLFGPASPTSQSTTAEGCAFFGYLPAGTYTATLTDGGYVDRQGNPNPSVSLPVSIGATASAQLDYDRAASATIMLAGASTGLVPGAVPVSVANPGLLPSGQRAVPGTGAPRTLSNLYPYPDGYDYWAGDCADADPESQLTAGGARYPGGVRPGPLAVAPGGAAAGSLTLPEVIVTVVNSGGQPVSGAVVVAHHDPDPGCPAGDNLSITTPTDGSGRLRLALPYGTWTFTASAGSQHTTISATAVTLAPSTTTAPASTVAIR